MPKQQQKRRSKQKSPPPRQSPWRSRPQRRQPRLCVLQPLRRHRRRQQPRRPSRQRARHPRKSRYAPQRHHQQERLRFHRHDRRHRLQRRQRQRRAIRQQRHDLRRQFLHRLPRRRPQSRARFRRRERRSSIVRRQPDVRLRLLRRASGREVLPDQMLPSRTDHRRDLGHRWVHARAARRADARAARPCGLDSDREVVLDLRWERGPQPRCRRPNPASRCMYARLRRERNRPLRSASPKASANYTPCGRVPELQVGTQRTLSQLHR